MAAHWPPSSWCGHPSMLAAEGREGKTSRIHLSHVPSPRWLCRARAQGEVTSAVSFLSAPQSPLPRWASPTSATTVAGATNSRVPWRSTKSGATATCRVSAPKPKLWPAKQVGPEAGLRGFEGRGAPSHPPRPPQRDETYGERTVPS